jgi:hypothetical protein
MTARSSIPAPRGAGGDPWAIALIGSPYNQIAGLDPSSGVSVIKKLLFQAQVRRMTAAEDEAFRTVRDLLSRLAWDLNTLGTTPGLDDAALAGTRELLQRGDRDQAERIWKDRLIAGRGSVEALHVLAVLASNRLAHASSLGDAAMAGEAAPAFIGFWSALLARTDWLWTFMEARCRAWSESRAPTIELDLADRLQFPQRVERLALDLLARSAASEDQKRLSRVAWERERVAIEVMAKARARDALPAEIPRAFGPLGLAQLGYARQLQDWLIKLAAGPRRLLSLTRLREGYAGFHKPSPHDVASAAAAVQLVYSCLGPLAIEVWSGQGRVAAAELLGSQLPAESDPWFGGDEAGHRALHRACEELRTEALLLQFREELSRSDVPVGDACATARDVLVLASRRDDGAQILEALENTLTGRVLACIEARTLPHPGELKRVLTLCFELRNLLLPLGGGQRCAQDIARLLVRRSSNTWNRTRGVPPVRTRQRILRDLFQAVELAPHNVETVEGLATVVLHLQPAFESWAEARDLLERVRVIVTTCQQSNRDSVELAELRRKIVEILEPDAAIDDTWKRVENILREVKQPPRDSRS